MKGSFDLPKGLHDPQVENRWSIDKASMLTQGEPFILCTGKKEIASKARSSPLEGSSFRNKTKKQNKKSKLD